MGEDDEGLVAIGSGLAKQLYDNGLRDGRRLLDVGSGYGRLAIGLISTGFDGNYVGFDILKCHVTWCKQEITPKHIRYRFKHLDVRNDRYNPTSKGDPASATFPVRPGTADMAASFSVFTHMYEPDIRRYLAELQRVLVPGGMALTTWFLFDADRLPAVTSDQSRYPMVHTLDGARYSDPDDPLHAVGYDQARVVQMVEQAGLNVTRIERGNWCGDAGESFQDVVLISKLETIKGSRFWLTRMLRWRHDS